MVTPVALDQDPRLDKLQMMSDLFSLAELRSSPYFMVKEFKDSAYYGEIDPQTNLRHGRGIITYQNGRHFEGWWAQDKRHGKGFERFTNGNMYQGSYEQGKVHGRGRYEWANGDIYDGQWVQGERHGYGRWENAEGDCFVGEWS
jgi:hypothetical protein